MIAKGISLKGLEIFEIIARTGSVAKTAEQAGMSLPAVSQQLRNLETSVGRPLLDHSRRPMQLTAAGRLFQRRTQDALRQIRRAQAEASVLELSHLSHLRVGVIDDFDSEVTPAFVTTLAETLTDCQFRLHTRPSHELSELLIAGRIDVAITSSPEGGLDRMVEYPLLRDPFILAAPRGLVLDPADPLAGLRALPFLRFDNQQMIGRQIEAQLRRLKIELPNRFEIDSNQSIQELIAAGAGWTITTPLAYLRGQRFRGKIDAHPLPFAGFSRTISLFCDAGWIDAAAIDLATTFRRIIQAQIIDPAIDLMPWLADGLILKSD